MFVTKYRLIGLAIAGRASAFFRSVFMNGKSRRVDPQFDEVPDAHVFLQDWMRYLETVAVFGVHGNTINQLVAVGESLLVELLFQVSKTACHLLSPSNLRRTSRTIT